MHEIMETMKLKRTAKTTSPSARPAQKGTRPSGNVASGPTRSWVDRLTAAIDRLPAPPWVVYLLLAGVELILISIPFWSDGAVPFPQVERFTFLSVVWTMMPLALIHHLDTLAGPALDRIRPACRMTDAEAERVRSELQSMPVAPALSASALGVAVMAYFLVFHPELVEGAFRAPLTPPQWFISVAFFIPNFALLGTLVYHTIRQLRLIDQVYQRADRLDLFNLSPLYAFAGLAARTVIAWAVTLYLTVALYPSFLLVDSAAAALAVQVLLLALAFTLPLVGIHLRIRDAKEQALAGAGARLSRAIGDLNRATDKRSLRDVDRVNKMITTLVASREVLEKVPTWPWRPGTPLAVGTTLFLPVALYLFERLVGRLAGL